MLAVSALIAVSTIGAYGQQSQLCEMKRTDAEVSPSCVRWYFTCQTKVGPAPAAGPYAALSVQERVRLLAIAVFHAAEQGCKDFSYTEANAALQSHLVGTR